MGLEDKTLLFIQDITQQPDAPYYLLVRDGVGFGAFGVDQWATRTGHIIGYFQGKLVVESEGLSYLVVDKAYLETKQIKKFREELLEAQTQESTALGFPPEDTKEWTNPGAYR